MSSSSSVSSTSTSRASSLSASSSEGEDWAAVRNALAEGIQSGNASKIQSAVSILDTSPKEEKADEKDASSSKATSSTSSGEDWSEVRNVLISSKVSSQMDHTGSAASGFTAMRKLLATTSSHGATQVETEQPRVRTDEELIKPEERESNTVTSTLENKNETTQQPVPQESASPMASLPSSSSSSSMSWSPLAQPTSSVAPPQEAPQEDQRGAADREGDVASQTEEKPEHAHEEDAAQDCCPATEDASVTIVVQSESTRYIECVDGDKPSEHNVDDNQVEQHQLLQNEHYDDVVTGQEDRSCSVQQDPDPEVILNDEEEDLEVGEGSSHAADPDVEAVFVLPASSAPALGPPSHQNSNVSHQQEDSPTKATTTAASSPMSTRSPQKRNKKGACHDSKTTLLVPYDYGIKDDPVLDEIMRNCASARRLNIEADMLAAASSGDLDNDLRHRKRSQHPSPRTTSGRPRTAIKKPESSDMDLRQEKCKGSNVFAYDALKDEHCAEYLKSNATFQQHWKQMQPYLTPNQRVTCRVQDAMIPIPSRPKTRVTGEIEVCASRDCMLTDASTSVDVVNENTFFDKRRQQLGKGLPLIVRAPQDTIAAQLSGRVGTMRASEGEPWPPPHDQHPPLTVAMLPRPPTGRSPGRVSTAGSHRPGTGRSSSKPSLSLSAIRPSSGSGLGNGGTPKFNARSPFLTAYSAFTPYDAQFFHDKTSMHAGVSPPSPYYFSCGSRPATATSSSALQASVTADDVAHEDERNQHAQNPSESLSILTETRLEVTRKCEDYSRREILKASTQRLQKIAMDYANYNTYVARKLKERDTVTTEESRLREALINELDASLNKLTIACRKNWVNAKLSEEVFPLCPVIRRGEARILPWAGDQSVVVDLRWAGTDTELASIAILVFDERDKFVCTITKNESLHCSISGKAVIRPWGNFKFRPSETDSNKHTNQYVPSLYSTARSSSLDSTLNSTVSTMNSTTTTKTGPLHPAESRSTFELLLHNLSPDSPYHRFVFVAYNSKKSGGCLSGLTRPYLTFRQPISLSPSDAVMVSPVPSSRPSTGQSSATPGNAKSSYRLHMDTRVSEFCAMRLRDNADVACYTIASVFRHISSFPSHQGSVGDFTFRRLSGSEPGTPKPPRGGSARIGSRQLSASSTRSQYATSQVPSIRDHSDVRSQHLGSTGSLSPTPAEQITLLFDWTLICHDIADASTPNLHRLPAALESSLFVSPIDLWFEHVTTMCKLMRLSDEFFEKVLRSTLEAREADVRRRLQSRFQRFTKDVEDRSTLNPLTAAMLRTASSRQQQQQLGDQFASPTTTSASPKSTGGKSWLTAMNAVRQKIRLSKKQGLGRQRTPSISVTDESRCEDDASR